MHKFPIKILTSLSKLLDNSNTKDKGDDSIRDRGFTNYVVKNV